MQNINYIISLNSLPGFVKTCPRCKSEFFENSGCFRVNANGKKLDIWLICRCAHCKSIWNMSVYERINRIALDETEYFAYLSNDKNLVLRHVFDPAFLQKNHAVLDLEHIGLSINAAPPDDSGAVVSIQCEYPLPISAERMIASVLRVSLSRVRRMQESQLLTFAGNLRKTKTGRGFCFVLSDGWQMKNPL